MAEQEKQEKAIKAREYKIAKRNDFIQYSRYTLTPVQNKAIYYLLSKVKPGDKEGKVYRFYFGEFYEIMKWRKQSYADIKAILKDIADKSIYVTNDDGTETLVRWLDIVDVDATGTGYFDITFHKRMSPYILDLQRQQEENHIYYTTYQLQEVALMRHKYSSRIYELLKSYQLNNKEWFFDLGELYDENGQKVNNDLYNLFLRIADVDEKKKKSIVPAGWYHYAAFNRDVLAPAKEEINRYGSIKIDYEASKIDRYGRRHRKYVRVIFYMLEKTKGEKKATEELIEQEYKEYETDSGNHQLCMQEYLDTKSKFFQSHEEKMEQEKSEKKDKKGKGTSKTAEDIPEEEGNPVSIKPDEIIDASGSDLLDEGDACRYPEFASSFPEFSIAEINNLFSAALQCAMTGDDFFIPFRYKEKWVIKYVKYYYDLIKASPQKTKTTTFQRLFNLVRNDYDGYAWKVNDFILKIMKEEEKSDEVCAEGQEPSSTEEENIIQVNAEEPEKSLDYYKNLF